MQELSIKSQGFPELLTDTGAQSPLTGPFWGLSTMVSPVYLVGSSSSTPGQSFPYPFSNFDGQTFISPGANSIICQTGIQNRGFYAIKIEGYVANQGLPGAFSRLIHTLNDGFTNFQPERFMFTDGTERNHFFREWIQFNPGDMGILVQELSTMTGEVSCSIRWLRLGLELT